MIEHAVLIVGAGPLGLALALALESCGVDCALADARPPGAAAADPRVLALSHGSRQLLERIGVWARLTPTPIASIHVSHRGHFGRTLLRASDYGLPALGYVQPAGALAAALAEAVAQGGIPAYYDTPVTGAAPGAEDSIVSAAGRPFRVRLLAQAEGAVADDEGVIRRDYGQQAIICTVQPAEPHRGVAWERFTAEGPVALLPCAAAYALVFSAPPGRADALMAMDDAAFLRELEAQFGGRLAFVAAGRRQRFPLALAYRRGAAGLRRVALGNAAQTLHPVAGQGFNLALRDAWTLADTLRESPDAGAPAALARYAARRGLDRAATVGFTDALVRVFGATDPLTAAARSAGLLALDLLPPLRGFLARRMIFGARAW